MLTPLPNRYLKFTGVCNDFKVSLDNCFREEKEQRRQSNHAKAKAWDSKYAAKMKEAAKDP